MLAEQTPAPIQNTPAATAIAITLGRKHTQPLGLYFTLRWAEATPGTQHSDQCVLCLHSSALLWGGKGGEERKKQTPHFHWKMQIFGPTKYCILQGVHTTTVAMAATTSASLFVISQILAQDCIKLWHTLKYCYGTKSQPAPWY